MTRREKKINFQRLLDQAKGLPDRTDDEIWAQLRMDRYKNHFDREVKFGRLKDDNEPL